jgi:hypothetical protein
VRNFAARNPTDTDITKVAVFDPENKIVGYSGTFTQGVRDIISIPEWGGVYILGNDGTVGLLLMIYMAKIKISLAACATPRKAVFGQARHAVPQLNVSCCFESRQDAGPGGV